MLAVFIYKSIFVENVKKFIVGLLGKSNMEMAKADMMDGCMSDGFEPLMPWFKAVHTNPGSPENVSYLTFLKWGK